MASSEKISRRRTQKDAVKLLLDEAMWVVGR